MNEGFVPPDDYTGVGVKIKGTGTDPAYHSLARIAVGLSATGNYLKIVGVCSYS